MLEALKDKGIDGVGDEIIFESRGLGGLEGLVGPIGSGVFGLLCGNDGRQEHREKNKGKVKTTIHVRTVYSSIRCELVSFFSLLKNDFSVDHVST